MAGQNSSDKTEQPTPKRIQDARQKGQVAKSDEFTGDIVIVSIIITLSLLSDSIVHDFKQLMILAISTEYQALEVVIGQITEQFFTIFIKYSLIISGVGTIAAIASNYLQVGAIFAPEAIQPKLSKLNPAEKLKQLFSKESVIQLLKSIIKIVLLSYILFTVINNLLPRIIELVDCDLACIFPMLGLSFKNVLTYGLLCFIIVGIVDFGLKKRKYIKDMMMSIDEVKQEYKEAEGDPHIKGKRKQMYQEIVNSQKINNVKRSSVVITNPTHLAIGLYYSEDETPLPIVTFKEQGAMAEKMIEVAKQENIPIMQDIPLAHSLMQNADIEQYIPSDLITPVVEILKALKQL